MMAWGYSSENYTDEYFYVTEENKQNHPGTITQCFSKCRSFSFAPSARYTWYEAPTYRLFSRVSMGVMRHHLRFDIEEWKYDNETQPYGSIISKENFDKTKWRMAYQVSPIGMCVGTGPLKFVAEIGYGCLGVCNIGFAFSF